jgi:hypothetical protein
MPRNAQHRRTGMSHIRKKKRHWSEESMYRDKNERGM